MATALVLALLCPASRADMVLLHNGGRIEGRWVNRDEAPLRHYIVELPRGGRLQLDPAQVRQVLAGPADDIAERRARGQQMIDGAWVQRETWLRQQGYEYDRGRWRSGPELRLLKARRQRETAEQAWAVRLRTWRKALDGNRTNPQGMQVGAIADPAALTPLRAMLGREPVPELRRLYLQALARIDAPEARQALVEVSLADDDVEVRLAALEHLAERASPEVIAALIAALEDRDNRRINRAAIALGRLGDPTALAPLIESLVTTHRWSWTGGGPSRDALSTTFVHGPASAPAGFVAGRRTEFVLQQLANPDVLAALVTLSRGSSFGYNQTAWRNWLAAERRRQASLEGPRRD